MFPNDFYMPNIRLGKGSNLVFMNTSAYIQERFNDPESHPGFLEMRLRNMRRKLGDGQRRYRTHKRSSDDGPNSGQNEDDGTGTAEWINLMERLRPFPSRLPNCSAVAL
ncbi:hypothetical protein AOLI_G00103660 [Acnodon oligacanthus]